MCEPFLPEKDLNQEPQGNTLNITNFEEIISEWIDLSVKMYLYR